MSENLQTKESFTFMTKQWIQRLGLSHWDIQLIWNRDDEHFDPEDTSNAYVWRANDYEKAKIYFNQDKCFKWTDLEMSRIVVHELLHLLLVDIENVLYPIEYHLHRDVFSVAERIHQRNCERAIDRLAYRMVDMVGIPEVEW